MCCAASGIERWVIVMVQLCCCVFTFVVFVGEGWLALVPAHLPHLRLLGLQVCNKACDSYITEILAAAPELAVINYNGKIVGGPKEKRPTAAYSEVCPDFHLIYMNVYNLYRQWALDG
jgi:hypothetical protein